MTTTTDYKHETLEIHDEKLWVRASVLKSNHFVELEDESYDYKNFATINLSATGAMNIADAKRVRDLLNEAIALAENF